MKSIPANRRNIQSVNGDGHFGDTFETSLKIRLGLKDNLVSRGRSVDMILGGKRCEIKQGAGELGRTGKRTCSGVSHVVYCPVYDENKPIDSQECFILERDTFVAVLHQVGLYRESKTPTNGRQPVQAIQTFWNRSKNAPHGKKYFALIDALYENQLMDWEEFLERVEKLEIRWGMD